MTAADKQVFRLAALLVLVALATSRIGLIVHELIGHGGTAYAVGGRVTDVELFWFAGGWIRYQLPGASLPAALAISLGGIAVETIAGIALACVRGDSLGRKLVRGIGAALLVHAGWYLATGAWHGFGDGALLYRELGDARYPVAIAAGAVTCVVAFLGARAILGVLADTLPRRRVLGVAIAAVVAIGIHAGLAFGELRIRRDATYTETMQSERDRRIARDYAAWLREHPEAAPKLREQAQSQISRTHRTFPFAWLLGACVVAAVIAGAFRARRGGEPISRALLVAAAIWASAAIFAVIAIDALAAL